MCLNRVDSPLGLAITPVRSKLPKLTNFQVLVLSIVGTKELSAREIRNALESEGYNKSKASFFQMIGRLVAAGLLDCQHRDVAAAGFSVTQAFYRTTKLGRVALRETVDFYEGLFPQLLAIIGRGA